MSKKWLALIAVAVLSAGAFFLMRDDRTTPDRKTVEAKEVYYCPMHKEYVSDRPGNCPICSMKLVKKEGNDEEAMQKMLEESDARTSQPAGASGETVFIAPQRQQTLGMKSVPAERKEVSREIRTVGKIAYDETRITHIHTKFSGWVEHVFVDFVGETVKQGQPLFTIYSPELVATQEEYLLALRSREELGKSSFDWIAKSSNHLTESARTRLQLWGISEREIDEIARTGKTKRALTIYSPVRGVVTQRAAYHHGMYVTPESEIYTIVDLSTVWLLADVYEQDLPFIQQGQEIRVEFPYGEMQQIAAKIEYYYPFLDPNTRTGQIRVRFRNPNYKLKPDQYVNVVLRSQQQQALVVPNDAVLNTGKKQYVFVDLGNGYFEPREPEIGMQTSQGTVITNGLVEGERVVTAANFLLDSEANLRGVLENMGKPSEQGASQTGAPANLEIQLLEPKTGKTGDNRFKVSVKDSTGKPVAGAEVEIILFMPQMGTMPPMTSKGMLLDQGNGIYAGTVNIQMAWTWETTITIKKDGVVLGSTKTTVTAR